MTLDPEAIKARLTYRDDLIRVEWYRPDVTALLAALEAMEARRDLAWEAGIELSRRLEAAEAERDRLQAILDAEVVE